MADGTAARATSEAFEPSQLDLERTPQRQDDMSGMARERPRPDSRKIEHLFECRRGDLNPHVPKDTSPSSWRVCQFRHSDVARWHPRGGCQQRTTSVAGAIPGETTGITPGSELRGSPWPVLRDSADGKHARVDHR